MQYTDSIRNITTNDFINFYQTIDILIIDDIQEFAGIIQNAEYILPYLQPSAQDGKQLILTSDRAPVLLQAWKSV